jgi:hypothetical protein
VRCINAGGGSTLKEIRLIKLQACPKNYKKIVPKLFEQTRYTMKEFEFE